ncbi:hypothetical protein REPUB_Repub15cG0011000 [Reevesia pubescens]
MKHERAEWRQQRGQFPWQVQSGKEVRKSRVSSVPLIQCFDWRSKFFSVFVTNLSRRVSRRALWEAFSHYGKVADVFIQANIKPGKDSSFTYAFIRFFSQEDAAKAIRLGNRRLIDGRLIFIKVAIKSGGGAKEKVNNLTLQNERMDWLHRSAIGRVHSFVSLTELLDALVKLKVDCSVSPMGGVTFLVTFKSSEEMKSLLESNKLCSQELFQFIEPWNFSSNQREVAMWISLEEVPLVVWHEQFFQSLGNSWGIFVRVDENTSNRRRFDVARMLVLIESRMNVPSFVSVNIRGKYFKILVSLEDCHIDFSTPSVVSSPELHGSCGVSTRNSDRCTTPPLSIVGAYDASVGGPIDYLGPCSDGDGKERAKAVFEGNALNAVALTASCPLQRVEFQSENDGTFVAESDLGVRLLGPGSSQNIVGPNEVSAKAQLG